MITREHLQAAIAAVHAVDPETGLGLKMLLDGARIKTPAINPADAHDTGTRSFPYYFDGQRVDIPKTAFVARGISILEQSLVFKLGELREKHSRAAAWISGNVRQLVGDIRLSGATALVDYELRRMPVRPTGLDAPLRMPDPKSAGPHFYGHLATGQPGRFIPLPLNRGTLSQLAGPRFEFFDIRFILDSWADGSLPWIFACVVHQQIWGLVKLKFHRHTTDNRLEVCYIARRMPIHDDTERPPKGIGTFLVAGVWMIWQSFCSQARHVFLDGELGARQFYLDCGFQEQRLCRFVLRKPQGHLLHAIADMADDERPPAGRVRSRLERFIEASINVLRRRRRVDQRAAAESFVKRCLMSRHQPYLATTALSLLLQNETRIPEAASLIDFATRTCRVRVAGEAPDDQTTVLVVDDPRFALHLQNVFHLESPKRFEAFQRTLSHPSIAGRWHSLMIEPAERDQLLWVHTADYLDRLERTAGRQLVSLDLDTQTTAQSWEVACLAVGGVFRLLDGICSGRADRGFAAVRPPGHHAEPDRAMGFCLLNNVALAARYLQKAHGLSRIMIVDLDAHHGNGTQNVFYDEKSVLFVSAHAYPAYPGTGSVGEIGRGPGEGFTVNIPMDHGSVDRDFARVVDLIVDPLAMAFSPEFMLVSLGFDLYLHDRLGRMKVSPEGYGRLTRMLIRIAQRACGGRIAFVLEGGYSVKGIETCGLHFLQALCQPGPVSTDPSLLRNPRSPFIPAIIPKVIEIHKPFWRTLA